MVIRIDAVSITRANKITQVDDAIVLIYAELPGARTQPLPTGDWLSRYRGQTRAETGKAFIPRYRTIDLRLT